MREDVMWGLGLLGAAAAIVLGLREKNRASRARVSRDVDRIHRRMIARQSKDAEVDKSSIGRPPLLEDDIPDETFGSPDEDEWELDAAPTSDQFTKWVERDSSPPNSGYPPSADEDDDYTPNARRRHSGRVLRSKGGKRGAKRLLRTIRETGGQEGYLRGAKADEAKALMKKIDRSTGREREKYTGELHRLFDWAVEKGPRTKKPGDMVVARGTTR
jgi:hypothetical protein